MAFKLNKFILRASLLIFLASLAGCVSDSSVRVEKAKRLLAKQETANLYYRQGQYQQAADLYLDLINVLPKNTELWFNLGNCYYRMGNKKQAEKIYREVLVREPSHVKTWYNLSYMQAEKLGYTVAEMYKNVDPSDPDAQKMRNMAEQILQAFDLDKTLPKSATKNAATQRPRVRELNRKIDPSEIMMTVKKNKSKKQSVKKINQTENSDEESSWFDQLKKMIE